MVVDHVEVIAGNLRVMAHDIPELHPPKWKWRMDGSGWWRANGYTVYPWLDGWMARKGRSPVLKAGKDRIMGWWSVGIPAMEWDDSDGIGPILSAVEALHPYVKPNPTKNRGLLPRVGFTALRAAQLGQEVPWQLWQGTEDPECPLDQTHKPPVKGCICGFRVGKDPWITAALHTLNSLLVVAPYGREIRHPLGARYERLKVLACVVPINAPINGWPADTRIVRAKNMPLKAWEIAQEVATSNEQAN